MVDAPPTRYCSFNEDVYKELPFLIMFLRLVFIQGKKKNEKKQPRRICKKILSEVLAALHYELPHHHSF